MEDENLITLEKLSISSLLPQLLPTIAVSLSSIADGMQLGWSAPIIPLLQSKNSSIKIQKIDEAWLETSFLLAGIVASPVGVMCTNAFGRKRTLLLACGVALLGWITLSLAKNIIHLYVARIVTGAAGNVCYVATSMYMVEIAQKDLRGLFSGLCYLMINFGVLVVYSIVPYCPFYVTGVVGSVLLLVEIITLPFFPETPHYLVSKSKLEEGKKSLDRLRNASSNEDEFQEIIETINSNENSYLRDLFVSKSNRKAALIMIFLTFFQSFCGFYVTLMNLHPILNQNDSIFLEPETAAIIFAVLMLISETICTLSVEKFGRKIFLIISGISTGICLTAIATYFALKSWGYDLSNISWILVVLLILCTIFSTLGLGILPQVVTSELFAPNVRALGLACQDVLTLVFNALSLGFYHYFGTKFGIFVPFFVYALMSFLSVIFTFLVVPETKGKSSLEIQQILEGRTLASRSSEEIVT